MSGVPRFKVYKNKEYRACFKYVEDAAILTAALGEGSTIRDGHRAKATVWTQGTDYAQGYEDVAKQVYARLAGF